ncbi:hypothetical protein K474DRAFT_1350410 [Panus rudis PR-1116 ss-1]|nr:hypothetical protein K474DRAFT_1350410 [Panus rudis PR-1116 ss-1]
MTGSCDDSGEKVKRHGHRPSRIPSYAQGSTGLADRSLEVESPLPYAYDDSGYQSGISRSRTVSPSCYPPDYEEQEITSPSLTLAGDFPFGDVWEPEKVNVDNAGPPASSREGWSRISKLLRDYDEVKIKHVKEDIDTLLVFAGLFSAVLTAFVIESYQQLQEDPVDVSTRALLHISQQLAILSAGPNLMNKTLPPFVPTPFVPETSSVRINSFWFSSLICSLVTASFGILVKQWLHEYMSHDSLSPRAHIRIRQFRYEGLIRWRVFEIAATLPMLIQIALMLFFAGLSEFLRELNPVVGWCTTALILAWVVVWVSTALASAFSPQCPYRSPMFKTWFRAIRPRLYVAMNCILYMSIGALRPLCYPISVVLSGLATLRRVTSNASTLTSLRLRANSAVKSMQKWYHQCIVYVVDVKHAPEESEVRVEALYDMSSLASADSLFLDDDFLEPVGQCLADVELSDALPCIRQIVAYRCDRPINTLADLPLHWSTMGQMTRAGTLRLQRIVAELIELEVDRILRFPGEFEKSTWSSELDEALLFVVGADFLFVEQEPVRALFGRLLGLDVVTARGVLMALCKHPSYTPFPQIPYTSFLPNVLAAAHELLGSSITTAEPVEDVDDAISIVMEPPPADAIEPVKLCMVVLAFVDQAPMTDIWSHMDNFLMLQKSLASAIRNTIKIMDEPAPWPSLAPTWSMNILRYLQRYNPDCVCEELMDALDSAQSIERNAI